jgi:glutathione S-transferase
MEYPAIVTILVLLQFYWFSYTVGAMRVRHGVAAPATSGHPDFDRAFRVQQNTLEQLVVFLPSLWLFAWFVDARWAAVIGLVFLLGRFVYRAAYLKDPGKRTAGFAIGMLAVLTLGIGALIGAVLRLLG